MVPLGQEGWKIVEENVGTFSADFAHRRVLKKYLSRWDPVPKKL